MSVPVGGGGAGSMQAGTQVLHRGTACTACRSAPTLNSRTESKCCALNSHHCSQGRSRHPVSRGASCSARAHPAVRKKQQQGPQVCQRHMLRCSRWLGPAPHLLLAGGNFVGFEPLRRDVQRARVVAAGWKGRPDGWMLQGRRCARPMEVRPHPHAPRSRALGWQAAAGQEQPRHASRHQMASISNPMNKLIFNHHSSPNRQCNARSLRVVGAPPRRVPNAVGLQEREGAGGALAEPRRQLLSQRGSGGLAVCGHAAGLGWG